jgi:hypothetical protein
MWGDGLSSIQETSDNGYVLAGYTYADGVTVVQDAWVLKLDVNGNVQWQKAYGGPGQDEATSIAKTKDGGYIVAGRTQFVYDGDYNAWVLKLDSNGGVIWQKTYSGVNEDVALAVAEAQDSGYIVAGRTESFGSGYVDVWIMKLDISGTVVWERTYGAQDWDQMGAMAMLDDGLIIAGSTWSFGAGKADALILKLDLNGQINPCILAGTSMAVITDTTVTPVDTTVVPVIVTSTTSDTNITPADTSVLPGLLCPASLKKNLLTVNTKAKHDGHGTVRTSDGGIMCPGDCKQEYYQGAHVGVWVSSVDPLSTFLGWSSSSPTCSGTDPCWVTMDKKKSVKALFQGPNKLKVATTFKHGGEGTVTSGGNIINCPGDCEEMYQLGALVTLTATPTQGYFVGWTGKPCKDEPSNVCTFTMDKNSTVKAIFEGTP